MDQTPHQVHSEWKRSFPYALSVWLIVALYIGIRYILIKHVEMQYVPVYLTNKLFAVSGLIIIGISYLLGPLHVFDRAIFARTLSLRRALGLTGFGCVSIHVLMSLTLLDPYHYPMLYDRGTFTLFGELTILFGILAFAVFAVVSVSSIPGVVQATNAATWKSIQRLGYAAYVLTLGHVYTVGVRSWTDPTTWPKGLYPLSLITFNFIVFVLLVKVFSLVESRSRHTPDQPL